MITTHIIMTDFVLTARYSTRDKDDMYRYFCGFNAHTVIKTFDCSGNRPLHRIYNGLQYGGGKETRQAAGKTAAEAAGQNKKLIVASCILNSGNGT
jgi:hypothetical protein